ncbi:MAG: DUF1707 domain-containing protein [Catenulispora sp.]|nr:DUF1707 domain-containing protein [Catenulispora sp.]
MTEPSASRAPHLRVSPEEREEAAERIRLAAGDGRLTVEELESRLELALSALTYGELDALVDDLPSRPAPAAPESMRLAISYGHLERVGTWRIPRWLNVELSVASAYLDFRSAPIPTGGVNVRFQAQRSKIVLAVPADAAVAVQELGRHRSKIVQRGRAVATTGPAIRLTGDLWGSKLTVKRPG